MDPKLFAILKLAHLLSMAVWFAAGLFVAGDVRRTLARGKPHTELLTGRLVRVVNASSIAGLFTMGTGIGMIFGKGGFKAVSPQIHAGLGLSLVAFALLLTLIRPAIVDLDRIVEKGDGRDVRAVTKKIAITTGIDHLLKLVVMTLMVVPFKG